MFTLLRGGDVFDPEARGRLDVLLCHETIVAMAPAIDVSSLPAPATVVDVGSHRVVPGFVDGHIHLIGGGGAEGFDTRLPELWLGDLARAGITTAVGAPGVDTASKRAETLLAKAYALDHEGLSTYVYAGGFVRPWASLTASVVGDLYAIPKVLGVKVALGEHRASRYARRRAGRAGRPAPLGARPDGQGLRLPRAPRAPARARRPARRRHRAERAAARALRGHARQLRAGDLAAAPDLARLGAWIDVTSVLGPWSAARESIKASAAVRRFLDAGVPLARISISSDANASVPQLDAAGRRQPYWTKVDTLPGAIRDLVCEEGLGLPDALRLVTQHPARALGLEARKGSLAPGKDADIVVMDAGLEVRHVFARGRRLLADGQPVDEEPVRGQGVSGSRPAAGRRDDVSRETVVSFIGVPYDGAATLGWPGARYAPEDVRRQLAWMRMRVQDGRIYWVDEDREVPWRPEQLHDAGDADVVPHDLMATLAAAREKTAAETRAGRIPAVVGGDDSILFPAVAGFHDATSGEIAVVHFDAHLDLMDDSPKQGRFSQSSGMRRALELPRVAARHSVQVGTRNFNFPSSKQFIDAVGLTELPARAAPARGGLGARAHPRGDARRRPPVRGRRHRRPRPRPRARRRLARARRPHERRPHRHAREPGPRRRRLLPERGQSDDRSPVADDDPRREPRLPVRGGRRGEEERMSKDLFLEHARLGARSTTLIEYEEIPHLPRLKRRAREYALADLAHAVMLVGGGHRVA